MHLFFYCFFPTFSVSHTCETLENDDQRAVALQAPLPCFCCCFVVHHIDIPGEVGCDRAVF